MIGYGIYTGGVRFNLARFFRITSVFLVLIAAGLLATSVHTAHEAGWWNSGMEQAFDFTWLVDPGSVHAALLTGMLGLQPRPTQGETVVYLLYAIPMLIYVLTPQGWLSGRLRSRSSVSTAETAS